MQALFELEEQGWRALSSSGDAGKKFYESVLHEDARMLFPGGMLLEGRETILGSFSAQPWSSYRIEEPKSVSLAEDAGLLVYRVTARREGHEPYEALISSIYVLTEGVWKLIHHQQTPV
jgi:hypothetical protein